MLINEYQLSKQMLDEYRDRGRHNSAGSRNGGALGTLVSLFTHIASRLSKP